MWAKSNPREIKPLNINYKRITGIIYVRAKMSFVHSVQTVIYAKFNDTTIFATEYKLSQSNTLSSNINGLSLEASNLIGNRGILRYHK